MSTLNDKITSKHVTLGAFVWEEGSINSNIRRILNDNGIPYRDNLQKLEVDLLGIGFWERVEHTLFQNNVCEVYVS